MRKRQSLNAIGHIDESKRFHPRANPSFWYKCAFCFPFCYFIVECSFPPKIRTTIVGVAVLVQWSSKALGGIKIVINPISTDSTLVDHIKLLLMGSTGKHLEVIIIPWSVPRWSWGHNSDRHSSDFLMENCTRTSCEAPVFFYVSSTQK